MTWFAVGAAVVGTAGSLISSNKAAKGQEGAAAAATQLQQQQFDRVYNDGRGYREAGNNALAQLVAKSGEFGKVPTGADVMADPGYQFARDEGMRGIEGSAAARGGLYSGDTLKRLTQFGQGNATKYYDDAFNRQQTAEGNIWNRYAGLAGIGQTANQQTNAAGAAFANSVGNIGMNNADNQGAAAIAQGNIIANGANQGASWFSRQPSGASPYTTPGADGSYANPSGSWGFGGGADYSAPSYEQPADRPRGWAEGGPVLSAPPVIGSRSPVRAGGGGGLSQNAIMAMLAEQKMRALVEQGGGVGQLPANPVTQPGAITDNRLRVAGYKNGGAVHGPRGRDVIPAMLTNGEHVVDEPAVTAIGGGSNPRGQNRLNAMRMAVKGGHR